MTKTIMSHLQHTHTYTWLFLLWNYICIHLFQLVLSDKQAAQIKLKINVCLLQLSLENSFQNADSKSLNWFRRSSNCFSAWILTTRTWSTSPTTHLTPLCNQWQQFQSFALRHSSKHYYYEFVYASTVGDTEITASSNTENINSSCRTKTNTTRSGTFFYEHVVNMSDMSASCLLLLCDWLCTSTHDEQPSQWWDWPGSTQRRVPARYQGACWSSTSSTWND